MNDDRNVVTSGLRVVYNVSIQDSQYKTYILTDQASQSRVEVVPERGGIITRWSLAGQEILYLDEARFSDPMLTVRGGIPILFPICGNLPNNSYQYHGQVYTLKQHGFARELPWQVIGSETLEGAVLAISLSSNDYTRALYPFEFSLVFTYIVAGHSLKLQQQITNQGSETMPFSLGLHPYFAVANKSRLEFSIPSERFQDQRSTATHSFLGGFDFTEDEIDVIFRDLTRDSASVSDYGRNLELRMHFEEPYSMLVFWTLKDKDFYCLEPWTGPRNALNTGDRLTQLPPGHTVTTTFNLVANING